MSANFLRFLRSSSAWMFGLATTVLLISFWGRAVVVDTDSLSDNLRPLGQSEEVSGRFADWMTSQMVEAGLPESEAASAAELAVVTPEVESVMGDLVAGVVEAAARPGYEESSVDVAPIVRPAIPAVTSAVAAAGVPVSDDQVEVLLEGLDPLVIREAGEAPLVGTTSPIAGRLGLASTLALVGQIVFAAIYILSSESRPEALRTLLNRFALGALSFAVVLKLGSWLLDPSGGRAPISESASQIADSKWTIPALIGLLAAVAGVIVWLVKKGSPTRAGAVQPRPAGSTPQRG